MKKFLAILLAATMIVGAFTFGVSAAATPIIGNGATGEGVPSSTNDDTYNDGVLDFESVSTSADLILKIDSKQDRYAVDIEFGTTLFNMEGALVWDVNKHDFVASDTSALPSITTTVALTNHSSLPVVWTVTPLAATNLNSVIGLHCESLGEGITHGTINTSVHQYSWEVPAAQLSGAFVDTMQVHVVAKVESEQVMAAIAALDQDVVTLGTITVKVEPAT